MISLRRHAVGLLVLAGLWLHLVAASDADLWQTRDTGKINWSARTLTVAGSGPPSLKAPSATVARLGAERTAKADAVGHFLETLRGVQVTADSTVGDMLARTPAVTAQVEALLKGFKTIDTRFFADGGVDITAEFPLDGALADILVAPSSPAAGPVAPPGEVEGTGVVVNAKGLKALPALAPRLLDENGTEVYSVASASRETLRQRGLVAYTRSLDAALKDARVADKPLIVRASRVQPTGGCDLVLAAADAAKVAALRAIMAQGRIIVVLD